MTRRYLYVDVNATFTNPTRNLLPLAFLKAADIRFFGPGHVSQDCLARGLPAFMDREGPFDAVMSNTLVLFSDVTDPSHYAEAVLKSYAFEGQKDDLLFLPVIANDFAALSCPRVVILLENDFYNWTKREADCILKRGDFFIGFGEEFSPTIETLSHLEAERFAAAATDIWAEFVRSHREKVASLLHFIGDGEVNLTPLSARPLFWSVMGVQYKAREIARDHFLRGGITPVTDTKFRKLVSLLKKTRLLQGERRWVQKALNASFAARIASTKASYTCGSGLMMPIRKFFEIPAAGSVLVCRPFSGFEAAGFRDGQNCLIVEPQDVMECHVFLERNPDQAELIARAGQKFVIDRHSLDARADQLAQILSAMADRRFHGSHWVEGHHEMRGALGGGALS